jgi:hypothetical protein
MHNSAQQWTKYTHACFVYFLVLVGAAFFLFCFSFHSKSRRRLIVHIILTTNSS